LCDPNIKGAALRKTVELKTSLVVIRGGGAQDSARSSIQVLTAFFVSVISIYESDVISGGRGQFHCSSIDSIVILVILVMLVKPEKPEK
jgi:hypothetical protein